MTIDPGRCGGDAGLGKSFDDIDKRTPPATGGWFTKARNQIKEELKMDPQAPNYAHQPISKRAADPRIAKVHTTLEGVRVLADALLQIDESDRRLALELASRLIGET